MSGVSKKFTIVSFSDQSVEVVPTIWISNQQCWFPQEVSKGFSKLQSNPDTQVGSNWKLFDIVVVGTSGKF
jgi:hypothetical protein